MGKKSSDQGFQKQKVRVEKNQAKYLEKQALTPQQEELRKAMEAPVLKNSKLRKAAAPGHDETGNPTKAPTAKPTWFPTFSPSPRPSKTPSGAPSRNPISNPTSQPSGQPSGQPSSRPSVSRQPSIASNLLNSFKPTVFLNDSIPCPPGYNRTIIGYKNDTNFDDIFNTTLGNSTSINNNNGSVPIYGNCSLIEQPNHSRNNAAATNLLPLYIVAGIIGTCIVGAMCFLGGRSQKKINRKGAVVVPHKEIEEEKPDSVIINNKNVVNQVEVEVGVEMYDSDIEKEIVLHEKIQQNVKGNVTQLIRSQDKLSIDCIEINLGNKEGDKNAVERTLRKQPRNYGGGGNGFGF